MIGIGIGIGMSTALIPKIGLKPVMTAGLLLLGIGVALLSRITVGGDYLTEPLPGLVVAALGSGFCSSSTPVPAAHGNVVPRS